MNVFCDRVEYRNTCMSDWCRKWGANLAREDDHGGGHAAGRVLHDDEHAVGRENVDFVRDARHDLEAGVEAEWILAHHLVAVALHDEHEVENRPEEDVLQFLIEAWWWAWS